MFEKMRRRDAASFGYQEDEFNSRESTAGEFIASLQQPKKSGKKPDYRMITDPGEVQKALQYLTAMQQQGEEE